MKRKSCARADDEVGAMLNALADDINHRPDIRRPVPVELFDRIRSLVGDVEVDLGQPLQPELGDADMPGNTPHWLTNRRRSSWRTGSVRKSRKNR